MITSTKGRRIAAGVVDWLCISAYAVALVPLGIAIADSVGGWPVPVRNLGAFAILILPATVWQAAWEQGKRGASPGKRLLGLRTVRTRSGARLGWPRALARNALKIALPWELGHTAVFVLPGDNNSVLGMVCGVAACVIVVAYFVTLLATGTTPYDRITGTTVRRT
jgi:uncharacterized RDD family membrane protein YckC